MRIGIYPGSFDPITLGHLDVIKRSSRLVDLLIIGVLNNSGKHPLFTAEERVEMIKEVTRNIENIQVESFRGLLAEFARIKKAAVIVRGLRAITDFEYELQMAQINHKIESEVDTIFFTTSVEYSYLSSSVVKEVAFHKGDISSFVPIELVERIEAKYE